MRRRTVLGAGLGLVLLTGAWSLNMPPKPFIADRFPADTPSGRFAIVISGDGLKTSLADALSERLATRGIGVARSRAISYFWTARSPKAMSRDLRQALRRRLKARPDDRFLLIGYSFGAGTLPFAVNRLPADLLARIDRVVLMAPPETSDFEFFFRSWLNRSSNKAQPTAPEIQTLSESVPVLYLRGTDDFIGPRDLLTYGPNLVRHDLPGGHDFDKDYDGLIDLILAESLTSPAE